MNQESQNSAGRRASIKSDPFRVRIQDEIEEFLRDLTLEYPFTEIFWILRRHEFKGRFGEKVTPLPKKGVCNQALKEIDYRIDEFLETLREVFGKHYYDFIEESFRYYTATTCD